MRFDVPLVSASLAVSVAALPSSASPSGYAPAAQNGSWSSYGQQEHKHVLELEAELSALKGQLAEASHTCDAPSGLPVGSAGSSPASASASWTATAYAPKTTYLTTTVVNGVTKTITITAATSATGSSAAWQTGYGSTMEPNTYVTTTVVNGVTITKTVTRTATATSTFACNPAHSYPNGAQCVSSGTGLTLVTPTASATSLPSTPDYYAPAPPASSSWAAELPTYTIIVTPGQSAPTGSNSSATGAKTAHTCTETYLGSAPIPNAPVSTAASYVSSVLSSYIASASGYIPIYPNGTFTVPTASVSHYPVGTAVSSIKSAILSSSYGTGVSSGFATYSASNSTSYGATGTGTAYSTISPVSVSPVESANSTSTAPTSTSASLSSSSSSSSAVPTATDCATFCSTLTNLNGYEVTPLTCTQLKAGTLYNTPTGQSSVGCAASFTPSLDVCQVTLNVKTSGTGNVYQEVWLPTNSSTPWNGRTMSTDNGGLNGCIHYVDMQYVSGLGFAAIGDNAGHNGSSFDGTWTLNNNEAIIDWAYRARHASVDVGKQIVNKFYSKAADKSYYIGCSTGGAQGLKSAQNYPSDFDGIIAGASAADFNHLQSWSAHFRPITGTTGNDTFLTVNDWTTVQTAVLAQCDEPLDGVADGILEDPMQCISVFDSSKIPICSSTVTSGCLMATQVQTVDAAFRPLYSSSGELIYPALLYGAQVDAFKLGLLSGSVQGIAQDFFRGGVYNDSSYDITKITPQDYDAISALDELHGYPSSFNGDLSAFAASGSKMMMYHGMADPMTSGSNSQRYYQKVAKTTGQTPEQIDEYMRFFRISGMAHCGVGGISGAGAWMFGQAGNAASATNNIVNNLVDWVEKGEAPETLLGTKFWYDTPSLGIEFERAHCRYPYRTTYKSGDSTKAASWGCDLIADWQTCEGVTCSADGSFS